MIFMQRVLQVSGPRLTKHMWTSKTPVYDHV